MTVTAPRKLPDPAQWVDPASGVVRPEVWQYFQELDVAIRALIASANATETTLADHETRITDLETP